MLRCLPASRSRIAFIFSVLAALMALGSCTPGSDPGTTVKDTAGLFAAYGVQTDVGAPVDSSGKALGADYNPFGRSRITFLSKREIFASGVYGNGRLLNLLDDYAAGGNPANGSLLDYGSGSDPVFARKPQASAAGDIDGDSKDEVVTVYWTGTTADGKNTGKAYLCVMGKGDTLVTNQAVNGGADLTIGVPSQDRRQCLMDIEIADIDGDGRGELGIVVGNTFLILDDKNASYATLLAPVDTRGTTGYAGFWATAVWYTELASGDVNGDGREEFGLISGYWIGDSSVYSPAKYSVYGGATPALLAQGTVSDLSTPAKEILYGNIAMGDIDNDGAAELCFSGIGKRATNTLIDISIITAFWNGTGFDLPGGDKSLAFAFPAGRDQYRPMPSACFKPEPNKKSSLLAANRVFDFDPVLGKLSRTGTLPENASADPDFIANEEMAMTAGDVDRDGQEEIVAQYIGAHKAIYVYKAGSGALTHSATLGLDDAYAYGVGGSSVFQSICLPDWDGDAISLEYSGTRETMFTDPVITALIASPPFWSDILPEDSYSNYSTSYGKSQGESFEKTHSFGCTAELSYAASVSDLGITAEAGAAAGASYSYTTGYGNAATSSQTITTIAGEDKVVYSCVPFDVYRYTILSSPTATDVGKEFIVSVPRKPQILSMELAAWNALPNNPAVVDAAFMGHSIGNPQSYLTRAQTLAILLAKGGVWDGVGSTTGLAGGSSSSDAAQEVTNSDGFTVGASITVWAKGGVLWNVFGAEASYQYEWNSTVSTSVGTFISGTVPDLPPGTASDRRYTYGVALYAKDLKTGYPVQVVSYWVNPLN